MNYWLLARPSFSFLSDYKISLQLPESDVSPPRRSLGFLLSLASALSAPQSLCVSLHHSPL